MQDSACACKCDHAFAESLPPWCRSCARARLIPPRCPKTARGRRQAAPPQEPSPTRRLQESCPECTPGSASFHLHQLRTLRPIPRTNCLTSFLPDLNSGSELIRQNRGFSRQGRISRKKGEQAVKHSRASLLQKVLRGSVSSCCPGCSCPLRPRGLSQHHLRILP